MRGSVFPSSRSEGVAEHYVTVAAPESDLKATSLQSGESLAGRQWVWCHKNRNESLMVTKQTLNCFHSGHLNKIRVFFIRWEILFNMTWIHPHQPVWQQIYCSYQLQWAEEEMNQLRRTRILYVLLQFGLQGVQWQIHSENVTASWWAREVSSWDISPRGWGPASVSADYQWTLLQRGAWLAGSARPLWTNKATMTTRTLQSYRDRTRVSLSGQGS